MKKIMSILALIMLVIPFTSVNAITGNYYVYTVGDEVNFYTSNNDKTGQSTIVLKDDGSNSQYVKTLALAPFASSTGLYDPVIDKNATRVEDYAFFKEHVAEIYASGEGWPHAKDISSNMTYITLDELKSVFGATSNDGGVTYNINAAKWGAKLNVIVTSQKGFFTSTVVGNNVWAVEFTYDKPNDLENRNITAITVKLVDRTSHEYAGLPVVYFDKTYDCTTRTNQDEYACYQCGTDYTWTKKGSQANTCTLVEDVTSKNKCVVSPKTGIEEYALELISLAAVCGLALVLVKRKDLFKQI